jgi:excinuclease ABC subunit A
MVKFSEEEIVMDIYKKFKNKKISLLAPLVRGRKGHYRELLKTSRKKGFLKVRVDGEVQDLVPRMQLDRYKIHDIEVVVDRLQVTEDMKLRVSQSVQKTLQMGKELLFLLINEDDKIVQYSKHLMCIDTGISYEEPSPNAFSFNSPYGACPVCKGLGTVYQVNMEAIIPDNKLSIREGAIAPLGEEREAHVFKQVQEISKKYKISLDKPVKDLSQKALNVLLYGKEQMDDTMNASVEMDLDQPETIYYTTEYEGVVNMVKRWFSSTTTSESIRDWAEQFMQLNPVTPATVPG